MKLAKRLFIITLFLFVFLFPQKTKAIDINDISRTKLYYKQQGIYKSKKDLYKIWLAAKISARVFPQFESEDSIEQRTRKIFCISAQETNMELGHVACNIPGIYLKIQNKTISHFSLDFGHSGLNQANVRWTYEVARVLQKYDGAKKEKKLNDLIHKYYLSEAVCDKFIDVEIPEDIKLKKIDVDTYVSAARQKYDWFKKQGYSPVKIYSSMKLSMSEKTQDEITSMMFYRILVEIDRSCLGLKKKPYNKHLLNYLTSK